MSLSSGATTTAEPPPRFRAAQVNRSLVHPTLPQPVSVDGGSDDDFTLTMPVTENHCFVVAADTQFGMTNANQDWNVEIEFSRRAVAAINALQPRPLFCCICGDLVDMTASIFVDTPKQQPDGEAHSVTWTKTECDRLQDEQNDAFRKVWSGLHPDIALVCLCGNHDVGNRPTVSTIEKFRTNFGDDYMAFWVNGTYNIVLNSSLFSDPSAAFDSYTAQLHWLEERLRYATEQHNNKKQARNMIFVFSHHPWFLDNENEDAEDLLGKSPFSPGSSGKVQYIPDGYFHIPRLYRKPVMDLFRKYGVSAAFSGHFHQNLVTKSSFGMEMIVTGSLSVVLDSNRNPNDRQEPRTQGIRIVHVEHDPSGGPGTFHHHFVGLT